MNLTGKKLLFLLSSICVCNSVSYADDSAHQRIANFTNYLSKMESGIRMLARYTEAPDVPRKIEKLSKGLTIIPDTNILAEILIQGDIFRFDQTIEPKVVEVPDENSITNMGWLVGQYAALDPTEKAIGTIMYYWSPQRQFSFTIKTNGVGETGGWVEKLFYSQQELADHLIRFSLPQFDCRSVEITMSNAIARSQSGDVLFTVKTNSASSLELALSTASSPGYYKLIRFGYRNPSDLLPTTIDSFLCIEQRVIHEFTGSILEIEYLEKPAASLPKKITEDIQTPNYRGIFEVASLGQTQIMGTNRVPVLDFVPPNTNFMKK